MANGPDAQVEDDRATTGGSRAIRVFVMAETTDHARGLVDLLSEEVRIEITGWEAAGFDEGRPHAAGDDTSNETEDTEPDVAVLCEVALGQLPFANVPVVRLSADEGELAAWDHRTPVRAWLPLQATPEEIVAAVVAVAQGFTVLTPAQAELTFQTPGAPLIAKPAGKDSTVIEKLTPRELQVLRMVAEGLGNKEIAGHLGISDHTAKFHVASILGKLHAQTRTEAVALGIRRGLVPI